MTFAVLVSMVLAAPMSIRAQSVDCAVDDTVVTRLVALEVATLEVESAGVEGFSLQVECDATTMRITVAQGPSVLTQRTYPLPVEVGRERIVALLASQLVASLRAPSVDANESNATLWLGPRWYPRGDTVVLAMGVRAQFSLASRWSLIVRGSSEVGAVHRSLGVVEVLSGAAEAGAALRLLKASGWCVDSGVLLGLDWARLRGVPVDSAVSTGEVSSWGPRLAGFVSAGLSWQHFVARVEIEGGVASPWLRGEIMQDAAVLWGGAMVGATLSAGVRW